MERYTIMHTDNEKVNCSNEFLATPASRISELENMGFEKVGDIYGLSAKDLKEDRLWRPRLNVIPAGRLAKADRKISYDAGILFREACASLGCDARAVDVGEMIRNAVPAVPVAGNLYLVDYVWDNFRATNCRSKDIFYVHLEDYDSVFFTDNKVGRNFLEIFELREVGDMRISPAFFNEVLVASKKNRGNFAIGPHLSMFDDFEKHASQGNG